MFFFKVANFNPYVAGGVEANTFLRIAAVFYQRNPPPIIHFIMSEYRSSHWGCFMGFFISFFHSVFPLEKVGILVSRQCRPPPRVALNLERIVWVSFRRFFGGGGHPCNRSFTATNLYTITFQCYFYKSLAPHIVFRTAHATPLLLLNPPGGVPRFLSPHGGGVRHWGNN